MTISNNELAIQRTKFANQRTYLAYMRTGFAIAGIAGKFKKFYIMIFGLIMIIGSLVQYIIINNNLKMNNSIDNKIFDIFPIIYVILSIGALYLQYNK